MALTQTNRRIAITTKLKEDPLLLRGFHGSEAISRLFTFELDLLSTDHSINFEEIVGTEAAIHVLDSKGEERYWHGHVSRFSLGGADDRLVSYRAQLVPWLWFLTRTTDCRIFQNQNVPAIIQKVFKDLNFSHFELRLKGAFAPRDYCVQYRETDFNFVSRLMEEEGIYYFFKHEQTKHTLILANDPSAHDGVPHQSTARYASHDAALDDDVVTEWQSLQEFRPGKWTQTDYNFETPSANLAVSVNGKNPYEIYDYPGGHRVRAEGDKISKIRLQEQAVTELVSQGTGVCRNFRTGFTFSLQDHFRDDQNRTYLLTSIKHSATQGGGYRPGGQLEAETSYTNSFECIPAATPFRPQRMTPQPFVQGCQTAIVVGPTGEEIYTDKHGRVKVQFHWDREGKKNENSSCWVRVSHPWAGKGWGSVSIPRIGQEVIVDFLEGNPDQPIIVGRVYNAEQTPPFGMPAGAMTSGIISNSTKGGGGNNEISLNDTKGKELINIHGQFDMQSKIGHDQRLHVVNNRTKNVDVNESSTIGSNRTEKVGKNEDITIGVNRTEKVGANETIAITSNRTETVGSNETVTITLTRTHSVGVNDMLNVGAAQEVTVGGLQALTVGAARAKTIGAAEMVNIGASQTINVGSNQSFRVGGNQSATIAGNRTESVGGKHSEKISGARTVNVVGEDQLKVDAKYSLVAADEISLKTGDASITLKSDGTIVIKGKDIVLEGSGKIGAKASGDVVLKGQNVLHN